MSAPTPLLGRPSPVQTAAQLKRKRESIAVSSSCDMEPSASIVVAINTSSVNVPTLGTSNGQEEQEREKLPRASSPSVDAIEVDSSPDEDNHHGEDRPSRRSQLFPSRALMGIEDTVTNTQPEVETRFRTLEDRLRELHEANIDLTERLGRIGGMVEGRSDESDAPPPMYTPANR